MDVGSFLFLEIRKVVDDDDDGFAIRTKWRDDAMRARWMLRPSVRPRFAGLTGRDH